MNRTAGLVLCISVVFTGSARAGVKLQAVATASAPVFISHARDSRLFIVEKGGLIRIFVPGQGFRATPFLDLRAKVSGGGERGLLSMAFHPAYSSNGFFYVNYTNLSGDTVIERYRVSTGDPNLADPASAATLLTIDQPFANHNGGQLQIGPDNHLYIGMGDGGDAGDPSCYAQRADSLLGKMLRLDIQANLDQPPYHGIPGDNPFLGASPMPDEAWALGLRNPWRFSFDRNGGDLFIADVGQGSWEEVSFHGAGTPGGQNFGWKLMEGNSCFSSSGCPTGTPSCNSPALTAPIHVYGHEGGDCSITGGYVYRGIRIPEIAGRYVFGDYCSGEVRTLERGPGGSWIARALLSAPSLLTTFGEDATGELYLATGNDIWKLVADPISVPALSSRAQVLVAFLSLAAGGLILRRRRAGFRSSR